MYLDDTITQNKTFKQKIRNFRIVYSKVTYIFVNTSTNILHCNKTKKYNHIHSSKKTLKFFFTKLKILSTKVDNICGTKIIGGDICLDNLFKSLVKSNSTQFKVSYNSQNFKRFLSSSVVIPYLGH